MHRLKQLQPKLHQELCNAVFKLANVRDRLVALPETFVLDGAISEILLLTDVAVDEARESLKTPRRRPLQPLTVPQAADHALTRTIQSQEAEDGMHTKMILLDSPVR